MVAFIQIWCIGNGLMFPSHSLRHWGFQIIGTVRELINLFLLISLPGYMRQHINKLIIHQIAFSYGNHFLKTILKVL